MCVAHLRTEFRVKIILCSVFCVLCSVFCIHSASGPLGLGAGPFRQIQDELRLGAYSNLHCVISSPLPLTPVSRGALQFCIRSTRKGSAGSPEPKLERSSKRAQTGKGSVSLNNTILCVVVKTNTRVGSGGLPRCFLPRIDF